MRFGALSSGRVGVAGVDEAGSWPVIVPFEADWQPNRSIGAAAMAAMAVNAAGDLNDWQEKRAMAVGRMGMVGFLSILGWIWDGGFGGGGIEARNVSNPRRPGGIPGVKKVLPASLADFPGSNTKQRRGRGLVVIRPILEVFSLVYKSWILDLRY